MNYRKENLLPSEFILLQTTDPTILNNYLFPPHQIHQALTITQNIFLQFCANHPICNVNPVLDFFHLPATYSSYLVNHPYFAIIEQQRISISNSLASNLPGFDSVGRFDNFDSVNIDPPFLLYPLFDLEQLSSIVGFELITVTWKHIRLPFVQVQNLALFIPNSGLQLHLSTSIQSIFEKGSLGYDILLIDHPIHHFSLEKLVRSKGWLEVTSDDSTLKLNPSQKTNFSHNIISPFLEIPDNLPTVEIEEKDFEWKVQEQELLIDLTELPNFQFTFTNLGIQLLNQVCTFIRLSDEWETIDVWKALKFSLKTKFGQVDIDKLNLVSPFTSPHDFSLCSGAYELLFSGEDIKNIQSLTSIVGELPTNLRNLVKGLLYEKYQIVGKKQENTITIKIWKPCCSNTILENCKQGLHTFVKNSNFRYVIVDHKTNILSTKHITENDLEYRAFTGPVVAENYLPLALLYRIATTNKAIFLSEVELDYPESRLENKLEDLYYRTSSKESSFTVARNLIRVVERLLPEVEWEISNNSYLNHYIDKQSLLKICKYCEISRASLYSRLRCSSLLGKSKLDLLLTVKKVLLKGLDSYIVRYIVDKVGGKVCKFLLNQNQVGKTEKAKRKQFICSCNN